MSRADTWAGRMWIIAMCVAAAILPSSTAQAEQRPDVRLDHDPAAGTVDVYVRGEFFTTWHYGGLGEGDRRTPILF